ncbi:phosphate/phosphite/phosphonate ABC transporter substrate-binding protein [Coralloluteibacterium thermophilus]|uniref:Phosphate/phosphite/phosphonate ABC transporter substrate-binding protein n=1 Tax=Coralloluteibacterium thermophilum TaxID=2707049 RepID=A0ABV9NKQ1_9GAMM
MRADDGVLVLGRITDDPKAHYDQLRPLLDYVVARLHDVGIHEGRVLMARDSHQMESYLRRGRVDWVTETGGMAVLLAARAGARPLLLTERNGVRSYRTVYVARRDAGIASFDDILGRSVAMQTPSSTSAYFVPAAEFLRRGMVLEILLSPMDRVAADEVGYVFARTETNIATWVHKGMVDVGVMSDLDWADPRRVPETYREDLLVFAQSEPYPRGIELVRGGLAPAVEARLREVLLDAPHDEEGREALRHFFGTTAFRPLDEEARAALRRLGEDVELVHGALE